MALQREVCDWKQYVPFQLSYHRPPQLWRHTGLMQKNLHWIDLFIGMREFSRDKHREFGFTPDMHVLAPGGGSPTAAASDVSPHSRPYFVSQDVSNPTSGFGAVCR